MTRFRPQDVRDLARLLAWAAGEGEALEIVAGGSKRALGRTMQTPHVLDTTVFAGIQAYEPEELVLTAGPATPIVEIGKALEGARQMLAFEPGDWGPLLGERADGQTLGGVLACNLAGPRRLKQGAARDHFLGFHAVSGRGEAFKAGGRVVKNVTGYDLSKLMAGSFGTLAVLTEVTVKVLPRPEATGTLIFSALDDVRAVDLMTKALTSPHEVGGAAHLPAPVARAIIAGTDRAATLLRVEGPVPSVEARAAALRQELTGFGVAEELRGGQALEPWRALANAAPFVGERDRVVWRISLAPQAAPAFVAGVSRMVDTLSYYDWGGGLAWLAVLSPRDGGAAVIRSALKSAGGHATLLRGPASLRAAIPVFEPQPPALAALSARIKESFDPKHILNPGRMYADL